MVGMYHTAYARATKDSTVYLIDFDTFYDIVTQFEGVRHRLTVDSVKQIRSARGKVELDAIEEKKQRRKAEKGIVCTDFKQPNSRTNKIDVANETHTSHQKKDT